MSDKITEKVHSFMSKERNGIDVCGVIDVVSFDESGVVTLTENKKGGSK